MLLTVLICLGEWISGPVCMYISLYLIKESHRKQVGLLYMYACSIKRQLLLKVSNLLNQLEFILVPVANPDGYAVS